MKTLRYTSIIAVAVATLAMLASQAKADVIPYPNIGTVDPPSTITAVNTGVIDAWFYGYNAADTDQVQIIDVTTSTASGWFFVNNATTPGTEAAGILSVNAGDVLEFQLDDLTQGDILSSNPLNSPDGINHAYITPYSGGTIGSSTVPAGDFVGMEDRTIGQHSDLDYNDDQYIFDNIQSSPNPPVPEPGTLSLFGTGLLGLAGMLRYRFSKSR
jgi:hypothetical protein